MDKRVRPVLDLIARFESDGAIAAQAVQSAYDVVWGGIRPGDRPQNRVGKYLTQMTVQQVLDWQDSIDSAYQSEASGRYQVMEDTLREQVDKGHISGSMPFDQMGQDEVGFALLERRGWGGFVSGALSIEQFGDNLAREWASLAVHSAQMGARRTVQRGQSYYAGDGLNKAHATPEQVVTALKAALAMGKPETNELAELMARVDALEAKLAAIHAATAI